MSSSTTMLQHYRGADRYMMAAIRKLQERPEPYKVCIQVVPAFCPHSARLNPVANKFMRQAQLPITIYTHADMVNKTAMEWIVQNLHASTSSSSPTPTPAFFVNVKDAKTMKRKQLESLRQALLNAALIAGESNMLVTGLPNAGKSSVIYPLTAAAVLESRKKKLYHAAKISAAAGRTAGIKAHRLEVGNGPRQLIDTPGLLPLPKLLQHDSHLCELWAAGALTGQCMGTKPKEWNTTELAALLLDGLNFHAELSNTIKNKKNDPIPPPYVASLQLPPAPWSQDDNDDTSDKGTSQWWSSLTPETFVTHLMEHERKQKKCNKSHPHTAVENFLRELRQGMHGGCLIRGSSRNNEPLGRSFYPQRKQNNNNNNNNPPPEQDIKVHFVQKNNSALVAMNETARLLVEGSLRL